MRDEVAASVDYRPPAYGYVGLTEPSLNPTFNGSLKFWNHNTVRGEAWRILAVMGPDRRSPFMGKSIFGEKLFWEASVAERLNRWGVVAVSVGHDSIKASNRNSNPNHDPTPEPSPNRNLLDLGPTFLDLRMPTGQ